MSGFESLLRPHVSSTPVYTTARSEHLGGILLDANENSFGCPVPEIDGELHRYPDPANRELRGALSTRLGVEPEALWIGNGSDEAIDLLVRATSDAGSPVAVPVPSYGVYAQRIAAQGASARSFRLDPQFDLDVEAAADAASGAALCFLCSPNNPTGNLMTRDRVLALLERIDGVLAVDEAYVEFAPDGTSLTRLAGGEGAFRRLVVIRTLSKAWGLAGARVGYLVAAPGLISLLSRIGLPYPLSSLAARVAAEALGRETLVDDRIRSIRSERHWLCDRLQELGLSSLPSDANFVCFFVEEPRALQSRLAARHGVIVRDRSRLPGLTGALRVTVGTREENEAFVEGLRSELNP